MKLSYRFTVAILSLALVCASAFGGEDHYNEVYQSDGTVRPIYKDAIKIDKGLGPIGRQKIIDQTRRASQGMRSVHPFPRILTQSEYQRIRVGAEQRARALYRFLADLARTKPDAGPVPRILVSDLRQAYRPSVPLSTIDFHKLDFIVGPDIIRGPDGRFLVLEDEVGQAGGAADTVDTMTEFLQSSPQYAKVLAARQHRSFLSLWIEHMKKVAIANRGVPVFYVPDRSNPILKSIVRAMGKSGIVIVEGKSEKKAIRYDSDGPRVYVEKRNSFQKIGYFQSFPMAPPLEIERAEALGELTIGNSSALKLLNDKRLTPFVEEMIRYYLHEEPLLKTPKTLFFSPYGPHYATKSPGRAPTYQEMAANRAAWVIKIAKSQGGEGVIIGAKVPDEAFRAELQKVIQNPGAYIAQEYTPLSRVDNSIVDSRVHVLVGSDFALTGDYPWGRSVNMKGNGKVNISQDGRSIATFIVPDNFGSEQNESSIFRCLKSRILRKKTE